MVGVPLGPFELWSNGTYVRVAEAEICLRHEELILRSRGCIGLGHRTSDPAATLVEFCCE